MTWTVLKGFKVSKGFGTSLCNLGIKTDLTQYNSGNVAIVLGFQSLARIGRLEDGQLRIRICRHVRST